jgi:uncharacterized protein (DUF58 family)
MIGQLLEKNPRVAEWFYGFKVPERGTVVLNHRRVYIVPTRLGWLFGGTLVILLIGSINYAISLGFALTFMLAGMGLVGMVHTTRNLGRMAVSAGRTLPVYCGEAAQFRLYLDGGARYDRPAILARHLGSGAQVVLDVPAGAAAEAVLAVPAATRGWLDLGRVMLETRYPLGLFRAWSYVQLEARTLVYPRPERAPLPPMSGAAAAGGLRSPTPGNEDFAGLRTYHRSDSPRHVAWKVVARSDEMLTKQFQGDAAAELWLDWALLPGPLDLESRLSRLAGWVLAAEREGARYGLRLPGIEHPPSRGEAHRTTCLEALALYRL